MSQNRVVARGIAERLERGHLHMVAGRREERLHAAMSDHRAGVGEEAVRLGDALDRIDDRLGSVVIVVGKTFDLVAVEDGVGLEERDVPFDLAAMRVDLGLRESAGIDDGRAALALADMRIKLGRLPEGHPHRRGKTPRHRLGP